MDAIVTLGDLELQQIRELESITEIPKLGVYGNHCSGTYMDALGIQNLHRATVTVQGVMFGGFEGSVRYKDSPFAKMYTQEEASEMLRVFPRVDVMVTHCPPFGMNDEPGELAHEGFRGLRDYLERERPRYLLHGHTSPKASELVTQFQGTEIVYVFGERVVVIA